MATSKYDLIPLFNELSEEDMKFQIMADQRTRWDNQAAVKESENLREWLRGFKERNKTG